MRQQIHHRIGFDRISANWIFRYIRMNCRDTGTVPCWFLSTPRSICLSCMGKSWRRWEQNMEWYGLWLHHHFLGNQSLDLYPWILAHLRTKFAFPWSSISPLVAICSSRRGRALGALFLVPPPQIAGLAVWYITRSSSEVNFRGSLWLLLVALGWIPWTGTNTRSPLAVQRQNDYDI